MKCPKCGAHSTIIENDGAFWSHDDFYYCYGSIHPPTRDRKIVQQGTQEGCFHTFSGFQVSDSIKLYNDSLDQAEAVPLDPWGVPVDTRGYPKCTTSE